MNRQILEVLLIKNSSSILTNDRDMYTRCILPEIPRLQRGKAPGKSHKGGRSPTSEDSLQKVPKDNHNRGSQHHPKIALKIMSE